MKPDNKPESTEETVRLNKYISNSGVCSRRGADKLIENGEIKVNGKVISELGTRILPSDEVEHNGKILIGNTPTYVLLNKPKGFITTAKDTHDRRIVMDLVKTATNDRIYPVGRLDMNTTGLLLLTNDGELTNLLTHPSTNVSKVYKVFLDKKMLKEDVITLSNGVELEDGFMQADQVAIDEKDDKIVGVEIHSGKNRIVRRLFEHLGYEVVLLDRVLFAGLSKKNLPRGKWRLLEGSEINALKKLVSNKSN